MKQEILKLKTMRTITFILFISITSLFSCKNSSQAMGSDKIEPSNTGTSDAKEVIQQDIVFDMIISFISKGEGIDYKLRDSIKEVVKSFNEKNNTSIKPVKVGWGREGEVDYNFILKNLSTTQKDDLVSQVKEALGSTDMAHLTFDKKSVHKR